MEADASSHEGPAVRSRAPSPQLAPARPLASEPAPVPAPASASAVSLDAQPASQSVDAKSTPAVSPPSASGSDGNFAVGAKPDPETPCPSPRPSRPAPESKFKPSLSYSVPDKKDEEVTNEDDEAIPFGSTNSMKEWGKKAQADLEKKKAETAASTSAGPSSFASAGPSSSASASASAPASGPDDNDPSTFENPELLDEAIYGFSDDEEDKDKKSEKKRKDSSPHATSQDAELRYEGREYETSSVAEKASDETMKKRKIRKLPSRLRR